MEEIVQWLTLIQADVLHLFEQVLDYLPRLIGGALLLVIGWFVARALRALAVRMVGGWDWLTQKLTVGKMVSQADVRQTYVSVAGTVVYWVTILFFVTAAAHTFNLAMFSAWLDRAVLYVPNIISGLIVMALGLVVGGYVRDAALRRMTFATGAQRDLVAGGARGAVILTGFVVGLDLIGIDTTILIAIFAIGMSLFAGGSALAFGLGARTLVSNLIGARQARRQCQVGDRIRIGALEGRILSLGQSSVVLETGHDRIIVPGKLFAEESSVILQSESRDA